jgi:predicted amidohydrolase YtcJ
VHAIGDRANGIVLDAFEAALKGSNTNVSALRPRLEHAQIMTKADMERLGMLGGVFFVFCFVLWCWRSLTDCDSYC